MKRWTATARERLRLGMARIDERNLRRLTLDTLHEFLVLAEKLEVRIADSQLQGLAIELLPPIMRGRE